MKQYDFGSKASRVGLSLTVAVHVLLIGLGFGLTLASPETPPPIDGLLIDFEEETPPPPPPPTPIQTAVGVEPRAEVAQPEEEVKLVQRSEAPLVAEEVTPEHATETTVGDEGDVEVKEPERKPINTRALFTSALHDRDSIAPQVAREESDSVTAGHPDGNTEVGNPEGEPVAKLEGRTIMGNLPLPAYDVQEAGVVVVRILVDQYGTVTNAFPGAQGTTTHNAKLWEAAKEAALKAKFNTSHSAPAIQEGHITYIFRLF